MTQRRSRLPAEPVPGEPLSAVRYSPETLELLALRRSTPAAALGDPGPDENDLNDLLRLAFRVPDHRKLGPWRALTIRGEARDRLGDIFVQARKAIDPDAGPSELNVERRRPGRAPVIVAVISSPVLDDPKKTPVWEQELSAGAACQTLLIAACAMGWAACWITESPAYDPFVRRALGVEGHEKIAGFIYIGTSTQVVQERPRPDWASRTTAWVGPAS
jgi:nitroreductase